MERYLYEQNKHWQNTPYESGQRRDLLDDVIQISGSDQIVAISGIRRCGKSVFLKQIMMHLIGEGVPAQNILLANLEFPAFLQNPTTNILDDLWETFHRLHDPKGKVYLFLDEIQAIPQWETWVKYRYDFHKGMLKFYITGSNSRLLSSEFATLLSGRVIEKRLYPFSFAEILSLRQISHASRQEQVLNKAQILNVFDEYLNFGGMPEIVQTPSADVRRELLSSYFETIIYRDIVPRFAIRDSRAVQNVSLYALENATHQLNFRRMAEVTHTTRDNVRDFLHYLQQSYMNFLVHKFDFSYKSRVLSMKKSYALDTGFIHALTLRFSPSRGALLENCVFLELLRRYGEVFYYRNAGECDFVVYDQRKGKLAVQVCDTLSDTNRSRELRGLLLGAGYIGAEKAMIITYDQQDTLVKDGVTVEVVPFWRWVL
jgi:predicted AAA+ superfamily ATPase